jgi:hypothetical protein
LRFLNSSWPAAKTSLLYITVGAIMEVWSGVWYFYLKAHPPGSDMVWYVGAGFALTGLVVLVIGLALGRIGRAARHAELPAEDVVAQSTPGAAAALAPVAPSAVPLARVVPPVSAATGIKDLAVR